MQILKFHFGTKLFYCRCARAQKIDDLLYPSKNKWVLNLEHTAQTHRDKNTSATSQKMRPHRALQQRQT